MNIKSLDLDMQTIVMAMIVTLETARQEAYDLAKDIPQLKQHYLDAELLYGKTVMEYEVPYQPVFDKDNVIAEILVPAASITF